jgi:hypothetical protein
MWAGVRCVTVRDGVSQTLVRDGELSERFMCRVRQVVVKIYDVFGEIRRRGHDEAAGAKPGTSPVDRTTVNVEPSTAGPE